MIEITSIIALAVLYGIFCLALVWRRRPASIPTAPFVGVSFDGLPKLQYDVEVFDVEHEEMDISSYLISKGRTGWRLHTIQRIERPKSVVYVLTWDRLTREAPPYTAYQDERIKS